jgi:leader peptidase (prepilin peptidase)/N-methyltransferase
MLAVLYGFTGLILGYKIPCLSIMIMNYKGKEVTQTNNFIFSRIAQLLLSLINGALWYNASLCVNSTLAALIVGIMSTMGLIIAFIDICIRIIPNETVLFLAMIGAVFQITYYDLKSLIIAVICMIAMMVIFTSVAGLVGFGKLGAGDVKLAGAMGLALGYPLIITAVIAMAIVLIIFIGIGLLSKKIILSTMLPMAPFMIIGFIFSLIGI